MTKVTSLLIAAIIAAIAYAPTPQQQPAMSFFITSEGPGDGANLGGLAGADRHCQRLAEAAGAGDRAWRAYLSTTASAPGGETVHARNRIGTGPWYNAKGVKVAESVDHLHSDENALSKEHSLNERGEMVNGRGDTPNMHDIITGSTLDGRAFEADGYNNCNNWTSNGEGNVRIGHHDRTGGGQHPTSWNSAHNSRGCSQEALQGTGGNGLFYCFAVGQ